MTFSALLRIAALTLAIAAPFASLAPVASAATNDQTAALSAQQNQQSGPYDGADWEAAKHAFY
jgi:hypothetical protein